MAPMTATKNWSTVKVRNKPTQRALRVSTRALPPPPVLPVTALAPLPPDGKSDGLLKLSVKDDQLLITVPFDSLVLDGDTYTLLLDDVPQGATHTYDSATDGPTIAFPLEAAARTEGIHELKYEFFAQIASETFTSEIAPVIVDLTKAGYPETLPRLEEFDPRLLSQGLSLDLLTELGGEVTASLGAYGGSAPFSNPAPGDILIPYIGSIPGDAITLTSEDLEAPDVTVVFTAAHLAKVDDGQQEFYYTITDRAGNISEKPFIQIINLLVKSGIDDFDAPIIEAAGSTSGNIILEAEARAGVDVTIPGHPELLAGDQVIVVWDGKEQPAGTVPGPDVDFDVTVEWLALAAIGSGTFDVTYYITRNGGRLGGSPATTVKMDLTIPGGPDIIPETPENENLKPISVVGDVDGLPNIITVEDSKVGAKATISWTEVDDTTDYFELGDVITVVWNGVDILPSREIFRTDMVDAVDIKITVPPAILQTASGLLDVTYKVSRDVTGVPDFNTAYSPHRDVDVKSAGDAPGGTGPLGKAVLDERYSAALDAYLMGHKDSLGGTLIEIPHYLNKKAGDKISVTFAATEGVSEGGADIPDSHWSVTDFLVPSGDEEKESSFFLLPEANLLAVLVQGNGKINYTVENAIAKKPGVQIKVLIDNRIPE